MAFKRTTTENFRADVLVQVANDQGGYTKNTFVAIFQHATTTELEELRKLTNIELIHRKLVGWELVDEDTKQSVPFTPENLEAILLIPPTPFSIATSFWEQINGARAKNS